MINTWIENWSGKSAQNEYMKVAGDYNNEEHSKWLICAHQVFVQTVTGKSGYYNTNEGRR